MGPVDTWECREDGCVATVERWRGQHDVECPDCGTWHGPYRALLDDTASAVDVDMIMVAAADQ